MKEHLPDYRLKVEWAKKHIRDLDAQIGVWRDTNPYRLVEESHPESNIFAVVLKVDRDIPIHFGLITGDAIHNLRSAFDILACTLVRHNDPSAPLGAVGFPVGASRDKFEAEGLKKIKRASKEAIALVQLLEPYKGGKGDVLWKLHRLDAMDKHTILVPVGAANSTMGFLPPPITLPGEPDLIDFPMVWIKASKPFNFPLKDGSVIMSGPFDTTLKTEYQFAIDVAFGEGELFPGEPICPTLMQLVEWAESVFSRFETDILSR